jgi:hypothetical protein
MPVDRRTFLRLGSVATCCSLAGCTWAGAVVGTEKETLRRVELRNTVAEAVEVTLELERNGSAVHEGTYRLEPGTEAEPTSRAVHEWRDEAEARRWVVRAKTPASEWRDAHLRAARETNCHWVLVEVSDSPGFPLVVLPNDCASE